MKEELRREASGIPQWPSGSAGAQVSTRPPRLCVHVWVLPHPTPHLNTHCRLQSRPALLLSSIFSRTSRPSAQTRLLLLLSPWTSLSEIALTSGHVQGGDSLLTIYHTTKTLEEK